MVTGIFSTSHQYVKAMPNTVPECWLAKLTGEMEENCVIRVHSKSTYDHVGKPSFYQIERRSGKLEAEINSPSNSLNR